MTTMRRTPTRPRREGRNLVLRFSPIGLGRNGPLVGIAGSLFFGRGRATKTPDARRAQHAQKRQFVRFVRFGGAIAAAGVVPRLVHRVNKELQG